MAKTYRVTRSARLANAMLSRLLGAGLGPSFMRLLTVSGRRSGQPRSTPVVPVVTDHGRWLVAPFGNVGWVRNARAAGQVTLRRGRIAETVQVIEVDAEHAAPVLRDYLALRPSGKYVQAYFDATPQSPLEDLVAEAPRHPAFEITPTR
jgi:deazaflavin-dependent oxidoreductase (nitroreductase family)